MPVKNSHQVACLFTMYCGTFEQTVVKIGFRDLEINDKLRGKGYCVPKYVNNQREYAVTTRGVARGGTWVNVPPSWIEKNFSPWITDRWLLCNWCHTPVVAKTKGKCTISTLIFRKFSGAMPQTPILGRGYGAPPQTPPPSALRRFAPPRLARYLRSLHRRVPPYKNPGYAPGHYVFCLLKTKSKQFCIFCNMFFAKQWTERVDFRTMRSGLRRCRSRSSEIQWCQAW